MSLAFAMVFRLHGVHLGIRIFQPCFYIAVTVMIELTYPQKGKLPWFARGQVPCLSLLHQIPVAIHAPCSWVSEKGLRTHPHHNALTDPLPGSLRASLLPLSAGPHRPRCAPVSLICLKPSRSTHASASGSARRRALFIANFTRVIKRTAVKQPGEFIGGRGAHHRKLIFHDQRKIFQNIHLGG